MATNHQFSGTSEFLQYLSGRPRAQDRLPALSQISRELGISVAALREQLEVARALGLVDVRPGTGMRRRPYTFAPAVRQSLRYALALEDDNFQKFAGLRNHLEIAYWEEAVMALQADDRVELQNIIERARAKLGGRPVQVPHEEHRRLHLLIYSRLENPFVSGILEAFWDAYEAVGLNIYTGDIKYLQEVWEYHARMVEAICDGDSARGRESLVRHVDLLAHRPE